MDTHRISRAPRSLPSLGGAALLLTLALACADEPTASDTTSSRSPLASVDAGLGAGAEVTANMLGTDLDLPLRDSAWSLSTAFDIRQKGGGHAAHFEITNPFAAGYAVSAKSRGTNAALFAWNYGVGRAAHFNQTNAKAVEDSVLVTTAGQGAAINLKISNPASSAAAVTSATRGLGPAGSFVVANPSSTSPALTATALSAGPAAFFSAEPNAMTTAALSVLNSGLGRGLLVNHTGADGNLAVFQSGGLNQARISKTGKGFFNGGTQSSGADVAEAFAVEGLVASYGPGDVLVISARSDRTVERSGDSYSTLVAGVYATKPGVLLTERDIDASLDDMVPMGVVGVLPTKVSGENGPIRRGDLLVTSRTPGHAMRGTDRSRMMGAVLGKALEAFDGGGTGVIRVLVNVQ